MKSDFSVKNFLLLLLVLVILFIPTYIAIGSYSRTEPVVPPDVTENTYLIVKDPKQNETKLEQSASGNPDYELFTSMINGASSISEIPETVSKSGNMLLASFYTERITTDENGIETKSDPVIKTYAFYFSTNKKECFFQDPDKKSFRINEKDAQSFLSNSMAAYLYNSAVLPVFSFMGNDLAPYALEWNYLASGNVYKTITDENKDVAAIDYKSGDQISSAFTINPSDCTITVLDEDESTLYDGSLSGFPAVSLESNTRLSLEIKAQWAKTDGCEAYGSATYRINADLYAPATFAISASEIRQGEFAAIAVSNVRDASKINFSSNPALPYIPKFYLSGSEALGFIPVSYGCVNGDYTIIVTYEGVSQTFNLKVNDYEYGYKESDYTVPAATVNAHYTDDNIKNYEALVAQICAMPSENALLCSGKFIDYQAAGALQTGKTTLAMGFGRHVTVNKSAKTFEHTGIDFTITSKEKVRVPAMNAGKVIAVGTDGVLGNYVVIDHGCGLRSWYAHLTDIEVEIGTVVNKADCIGKTASSGATGFTAEGRLHIGLTVGNQAVTPYDLWKKGITLPSFY